MPKMVILAVCEKVLVERSGLPSLINVFQRMNIQLQDAPLPENAISPTRWSIFTLWQHEPHELGVEFVQKLLVLKPNGEAFEDATTPFKITEADDLQSKNHIDLFGLPINDEGFVQVKVWIEGEEDSAGEYRFYVKHNRKEPNEGSNTAQIN